jgi:hypothetical protein
MIISSVWRYLRYACTDATAGTRDPDSSSGKTLLYHLGARPRAVPPRSCLLVGIGVRALVLGRLCTLAVLRRHLRPMRRQQALTFDPHIGHIITTLLRVFCMPVVRGALRGRPRRLVP